MEDGKTDCLLILFYPGNLSVEAEVDLLSYCAREWKGEAPRARLMRKVCVLREGRQGRSEAGYIQFCFPKPKG